MHVALNSYRVCDTILIFLDGNFFERNFWLFKGIRNFESKFLRSTLRCNSICFIKRDILIFFRGGGGEKSNFIVHLGNIYNTFINYQISSKKIICIIWGLPINYVKSQDGRTLILGDSYFGLRGYPKNMAQCDKEGEGGSMLTRCAITSKI